MFPLPNIFTLAKYGFLTMVMTSAGFLIGNVIVLKHQIGPSTGHLIYNPNTSLPLEGAASVLRGDYSKCLTEPTKTFCPKSEKEQAQILNEKQKMMYQPQEMKHNVPSDKVTLISGDENHWNPIYALLHTFSGLMMKLDIQPMLLEPSVLYCTLSTTYKIVVRKKGFSPSQFKGSRQIITVGIFERDSKILLEEESRKMVADYGFQMEATQQRISNEMRNEIVSGHFFFKRHDLVVHAVVFFYTSTFFTHFGLPQKSTKSNILFNVNGAFENFTYIPLQLKDDVILKYNVPSNPAQFLLQIKNSKVEGCTFSEETAKTASHPTLTEDQLINRAVVAIQALKAVFLTRLIDFFLWEESVTGWHQACNIFHTKPELNVGVLSTSISGMNLSELWRNNEYLTIQDRFRLEDREVKVSLDCHGLRVNIFVCLKTRLGLWYYGKERLVLYPNKLLDPTIRLCSSDVLGQRINIPCRAAAQTETGEVGTLLTLNGSLFNE